MRIVAGEFRGRKLHSPKNSNIRPTSDRVRESIFNIIMPHLPNASILDLFAGTGALGLEALSRGAAQAVFVDDNSVAIRLIKENIKLCGAQDRVEVFQGAVDRVLSRLAKQERMIGRFHVVFLDPPYGKGFLERTIVSMTPLVGPAALAVAEHHRREVLPPRLGDWALTRERKYGDTKVSFYLRETSPTSDKPEAEKHC
ncbi:MAG: 16S rRNA (guanine(966)-N(2))-methyltransferase RsmD [Desulforhabdus sp.]|jgi:16S rRNA (guanine(966)-N(2))-methyltransferase RsmD|nr:16S rRNA (guanine(966)-N(2))-methyltransferase RsmD [Desulforhabdus sp.]